MFITSWFSVTGPLRLDTHLRLVREVTWPVRADWYSLGEQLGVPEETRKVLKIVHCRVCIEVVLFYRDLQCTSQAINEDNLHARNFVDVCFTALLEYWLTQTPSWSDLIRALRSQVISREDVALRIETRLY